MKTIKELELKVETARQAFKTDYLTSGINYATALFNLIIAKLRNSVQRETK